MALSLTAASLGLANDYTAFLLLVHQPSQAQQLPTALRESNTLDTFKRRLKTHLTSLTTRNV